MTTLASSTGLLGERARSGLLWTEYGYLFAVLVAAIVAVDPFHLEFAADPVVKHLALMITLPMVLLGLAGRKMRVPWERSPYEGRLVGVLWPFLLLGAVIVTGSLYARFAHDVQNTFLNVGLYMFVAWCAGAIVLRSDAPEALLRWYFRILLAAALVMCGFLIANFGVRQVYHEQIFLVIPLAALFFVQDRSRIVRWAGCAFFLLMAWLSHKYTSFIIGAVVILYLMVIISFPRLAAHSRVYRTMVIYWSWLALIALAGLAVYGALHDPSNLPSGNTEYRGYTYAAAWERFLGSPLWGTLFAVEAAQKFALYGIGVARNVLPTHSDVMDLLANGGIVAMLLWIAGLARAALVAHRSLLRPGRLHHPWAPWAHTLALMSVAGVLTYAFNPILLQPALAYLLWTNLGLLVGLSLRARGGPISS